MALLQTSTGDTDELSLLMHIEDGAAAHITHTGTQTTDELEYSIGNRALEGYTTLNAFGNELLVILLEVTVLGALSHSTQRAHAAVYLEAASLIDFHFTGSLFTASQQRTEHYSVGTGSQSLDYIAGVLDTAVSDDRNAILGSSTGSVIDGSDLRYTDTGYYTGSTDRTRADTYLDSIRTGFDQSHSSLSSSDIAGDEVYIREGSLYLLDTVDDALAVTMSGIQYQHIHMGIYQGSGTIQYITRYTDGSGTQQTTVLITGDRKSVV